jgi:hypothetical protein
MNKEITITNITGAAPFNVYVCDNTLSSCIYINTIFVFDLPYSFLVPDIFLSQTNVIVKVIDANNCIIQSYVNL